MKETQKKRRVKLLDRSRALLKKIHSEILMNLPADRMGRIFGDAEALVGDLADELYGPCGSGSCGTFGRSRKKAR